MWRKPSLVLDMLWLRHLRDLYMKLVPELNMVILLPFLSFFCLKNCYVKICAYIFTLLNPNT